MSILNITYNPPAASTIGQLFSTYNASEVNKAAASVDAQASTIVTLSLKGQQLSQSSNNQTSQAQSDQSKTAGQIQGGAQNPATTGSAQSSPGTQTAQINQPAQSTQSNNNTNGTTNSTLNNNDSTGANNASNNAIDSAASESSESAAKEAREAPGIQRQEGETRGQYISVYA